MKIKVETDKAPKATGPFSQAVVNRNLVFTSGQIYLTKEGKLLEDSFETQVHQVMKNLQEILKEAGVTFGNVVKTTIYITDMSFYAEVNQVYNSYFSPPHPAREVVCVKELPLGAKVEISMIAIKD